jgi:hypothetical protein
MIKPIPDPPIKNSPGSRHRAKPSIAKKALAYLQTRGLVTDSLKAADVIDRRKAGRPNALDFVMTWTRTRARKLIQDYSHDISLAYDKTMADAPSAIILSRTLRRAASALRFFRGSKGFSKSDGAFCG